MPSLDRLFAYDAWANAESLKAVRGAAAPAAAYVNSRSEEWSTTVEDILLHVVLHSAYHRGQVAYILRAGGATPPYTDYVHCIRNGLVE